MKEAGNVTVTILADNAAAPPYRAEHGYSALVETRGTDGSGSAILFDTGTGAIFGNAAAAGIDLARVGDVVLSHGHYDHTDALAAYLDRYPATRVHASAEIFREHYSLRTGACRAIALSDESRAAISALPRDQFRPFGKAASVPGGIRLAGRIPRAHPLETPSPLLFGDPSCTVPDEVPDEIVLWIDTPDGLAILTGCCHAGFINTCEYVRAVSGIGEIHAVIGGFHLSNVGEERLRATAEYIERTGIRRVIPCHCTGEAEIEWLKERLGPAVTKGECGTAIRL